MDVIRDRAIVELNQNKVRVLDTNLEATRDRFEIGDLTRTDVAQSEARLAARPRRNLATAQGRLTASEENYRRVIGQQPGPAGAAAAAAAAAGDARRGGADRAGQQSRPDRRSTARLAAAGYDVSVARAGRLPTVSAVGQRHLRQRAWRRRAEPVRPARPVRRRGTQTTVGVNARIPLYQGGLAGGADPPGAGDRRPAARADRSRTERAVVANTRSAFASYHAAQRRDRLERGRGQGQRARARRRPRRAAASAPAPCSTCSTPSRNCSTRRSRW